MEIPQIKRVVFRLAPRRGRAVIQLELQAEDGAVGQHHSVDALFEPHQVEFQRHGPGRAVMRAKGLTQRHHLMLPGGLLFGAAGKAAPLLR